MPTAIIEVRKSYTPEQEAALMQAVQSAVQLAFKILNQDVKVRFVEHLPHRFLVPALKSDGMPYENPQAYTLVSIDCYIGRSVEAKRTLYRTMVDNLYALGIPRDHIKILIRESHKENWGIRGGQAGCDVPVGYAIEI